MKLNSVMKHSFSQVPAVEIPRSVFDRTHGYKTAFNPGWLVPFYVDEALPGDTFNLDATLFARLSSPLFVPAMDNLHMDTFYFSVPIRLIWDNWQKFCGEKTDPDDSTTYLTPQIVAPAVTGFAVSSLEDYFGLPIEIPSISVCSFWHRAYNLIWNEWFRDQNLQDSVVVDKDDGPDSVSDYVLLKRGKRHDYFTSCLPWPQKGPGVELPLGESAPVIGIGKVTQSYDHSGNYYETDGTGSRAYASSGNIDSLGVNNYYAVEEDPNNEGFPNIRADLSAASAATINSLRQAFQIQRLYERDARGGTRYTEIVRAHFGVTSPDARLQRPEFLGGNSTPMMINPITQNSVTPVPDEETLQTPLGWLGGQLHAVSQREGFTKSFVEHSVIIGLVSVRADLTYQQGIPRMFSRRTRFDFYWPALAHLGEQAVLNKEIYAQDPSVKSIDGVNSDNDLVFGYQERFAEYRYYPSKITGYLRSILDDGIDQWHFSQFFTDLPVLDETFIKEDPPIDRTLAVQGLVFPNFVFDSYIKCRTVRPMPVYSVPGLIDHF